MRLHQDREAFEALLSDIGRRTGIRNDIIEKDYYITLILYELAGRQDTLPAYFKGGTALYKAIGWMKRFSEDIDLTVEVRDCSKTQGKKRLETAANGYSGLRRTSDKERESNQRGSITSVYEYDPVTAVDENDALQRFGYVKVEATSFTVSEPIELLEVAPLLYTEATLKQREILETRYEILPFSVRTIKLESFWPKNRFIQEIMWNVSAPEIIRVPALLLFLEKYVLFPFAEVIGRQPGLLPKLPDEIAHIIKAAIQTDLQDGFGCAF